MIYQVLALRVWVGDHWYQSFDYAPVGFTDEAGAARLAEIKVPKGIDRWPECFLDGEPMFRLVPVTAKGADAFMGLYDRLVKVGSNVDRIMDEERI